MPSLVLSKPHERASEYGPEAWSNPPGRVAAQPTGSRKEYLSARTLLITLPLPTPSQSTVARLSVVVELVYIIHRLHGLEKKTN